MTSDFKKMATWIAIASCDRSTYWDAIVRGEGVDWETLSEIGLVEADADYVKVIRDNQAALAAVLEGTREAFKKVKAVAVPWDVRDCPAAAQIKKLAELP